ncbi:MAG: 8-oxoguanine deaminase, partial [Candidatus Marinimicrobia bacterium]|nr:8-oxoguanine deaminase [Candidatus Neomarinimicrobiota bacterium]
MSSSILIKNPLLCCRMDEDVYSNDVLNTFSGGHIYIEGNKIISAGPEEFSGTADRIIDASRTVALPGFVNTHHHFYQTLTRNIFATQKSELFDWLITNYKIWRGISGEAIYISAKLAIAELLKSGCTTTSDHLYLFPNKAEPTLIDREIEAAREMGIRFQPTRGSMSRGKSDGGLPPDDVIQTEAQIIEDTYRLIKEYHDNSFGAMTRISLAPCSPFSVTPELMKETARIARENKLQIHTHLAETADEVNFCLEKFKMRPFDFMKSVDWIDSNAWFAHSIYLNDDEIRQVGAAQIGISHCPSSNMRLGSGIARIKEMFEAGVKVSLAVDGSASNDSSNMLMEMRNALLLSRLREPEYWLNTEEVLWMATVGGAKALGRDDIGQIAPGKCADLTLISMDRLEYSGAQHDPAAAILFCVAMSPVDWVIVNGKIIVEEGRIKEHSAKHLNQKKYLNEKALIARHQQLSDDLIAEAE